MDENDCRELARLYKIANAIGNSLDPQAVLSAALGAFVEQLACSAGAIFLASSAVLPDEPAVAVPVLLSHNPAVQIASSLLPAHITAAQWHAFCRTLPQQGRTAAGDVYLLLGVGDQGMLVLFGCRVAVSPAFVTALTPLLARLLHAYQNCLQHAELASAHRGGMLENNILRTLLEATPTVLFALDREGTCTYLEGQGLELSGRKPSEVVGQPISDIFGDIPQILDSIESALAGERRTDTIQVGNRVWDVTYGPLVQDIGVGGVDGGLAGGVVGVAHDVTEHRAAMNALATVLTSIMGWTETLLTEHPGPINDIQRRFLNTVYASSQRLNRLIEEILTVSRIQRGTLRVNSEPMSPSELLATVRSDLAPSAERQRVRLHFEDSWPAGEQIIGDPHLLEQVLNNLIGNAVKFSPQDSDVFVRSRLTPIGSRVEVEDRGMGVRAADLPKLFNRFVRGSNAKEAHMQGAGLGLFVSKAIVEAHGGTIYLTSREGEGTTAAYELPRQRFYGSTELSCAA